ncbi:S41 family peptidase [Chitinophaga pinensis]|uniref:Peptidase S41 n=1 Tax=Chitinophaga pinensis (strain ATCC 43595 / DSM 2588 / LMG 13176 / NBRC 15968 / NCIMB 11800 / UQM 2034) TaxID=485918 RepID=A0A979GZC0_CHIPD|nr:S41 family peptidase [Chitinophaga pinensis]ACU62435.1 peptidase S41 [Chitinophaga pinensis DSM 2588]
MFTRITTLLTVIILHCCCFSVSAQRADSLKADLQLLKTKLLATHPDIYAYIPENKWADLFDSCYQQINDDTDERQFYGIVKILLSAVGDGHLSSGAPAPFAQFIHTENSYLPLLTYITEDSIFITSSVDNTIPAGSQLISVNSHPANVMLEKMRGYLMADGYNTTKRNLVLNQIFYFYYYLAYGYSGGFTVTYTAPSGQTKTVSLTAAKETAINALKTPSTTTTLLSFFITNAKTGILTIKTFGYSDLQEAKLDYPAFLEQSFRQLKKAGVKKLIIDLRDNGGGRDAYGVLLYSYLSRQPFHYYRYLEKDKKKLSGKPGLGLQHPVVLHYDYQVAVLINGQTFSAAAEFCAVAYSNDRAIFFGEETGGAYEGNHSGQLIETVLPFSKVSIWIPTVKYAMDVRPPKHAGHGIIPHKPIQMTVDAYMQQDDKVMEAALQWTQALK